MKETRQVATFARIAAAAALLSCRDAAGPSRSGVLFISSTVVIASDGRPFNYQIVVDSLPPIATASDDIESSWRVGPLSSGRHAVTLRQLAASSQSRND